MRLSRVLLLSVFCSWSGSFAFAQYNTLILPIPAGIPDDQNTSVNLGGMNNKGEVAGYVTRPNANNVPVRWTNGIPTVLPMPAGYKLIEITGMNDAGQVVAQIGPDPVIPGDPNAAHVVVWSGIVPTIIPPYYKSCGTGPPLDETKFISNAFGINRAGHVAGLTDAIGGCTYLGWIWDGAAFGELSYIPTCLGSPFNVTGIQPFGINDADHIVSNLYIPPCFNPQLWNGNPALVAAGVAPHVLPLPAGYFLAGGNAIYGNLINNLDQTYGISATSSFIWNGTSYSDAGPGNFLSVNNLGQALLLTGGTSSHLYVWQNGVKTQITFPASVQGAGSPAAINDAGQIGVRIVTLTQNGSLSRTALLTPSGSCAGDVSQQVTVTRGGFRLNHTTGHYTQTVTVTNHSGSLISGPISLVLDDLVYSASLYDLSGATGCAVPAGSAFINVASDLAANGSVSMALDFIDTANTGITYNTRVLAGAGLR
jgi:hypothetical protein